MAANWTPDGWVDEHTVYNVEAVAFLTVCMAATLIVLLIIKHWRN